MVRLSRTIPFFIYYHTARLLFEYQKLIGPNRFRRRVLCLFLLQYEGFFKSIFFRLILTNFCNSKVRLSYGFGTAFIRLCPGFGILTKKTL